MKYTRNLRSAAHPRRRGSTLVTVLVITAVLTVLATVALTVTTSSVDEVTAERQEIQALYAAEAGVNAGLARVAVAFQTGAAVDPNVGTQEQPESLQHGEFWTSITDNGDGTLTVFATGSSGLAVRSLEAVLVQSGNDPFAHSIYAGNLSRDPAYELELGGTGAQADHVTGDVYSGGDLAVSGDALLEDELSAAGTITGATGTEGVLFDVPQILETDYEEFHDYDVAALFAASSRLADDAGGVADQLPATSPAHIFRRNPDDRTADTVTTEKDDYFLEDPYEVVSRDDPQDGSEAFLVSLPEEANNSVFFIDGNLWLHNRQTFSLKIKNEGLDPTRVTFVVKGNVYFSDNFFYGDASNDGVAFLALADPKVEDSGNIYFGDPVFGTMQYAEALMFAEDTFYDNNLDAAGSTKVEVRGVMSAGNQLSIERDYVGKTGITTHTKLELTYDPRQAQGLLNLPGIPMGLDDQIGYSVATWREVAVPAVFVPAADPIDVESPPGPSPDDPMIGGAKDWRTRWAENMQGWQKQKRVGKWN